MRCGLMMVKMIYAGTYFFPLVVRLNKMKEDKMIMAYEENQRYIQNSGGKISLIRRFERREYKNI
jgi:hypothetical protein